MEHKVEARKSRKKEKAEKKEKLLEDDIFKAKDESLISRFKDSKLIQSHKESTLDRGGGKTVEDIVPTEGVIYQPDIDSPEKIRGEIYHKKQRDFQEEILRKMTQRKISMKEIAKGSFKRKATLNYKLKDEDKTNNSIMARTEALELKNEQSLDILSDNEIADEDIIKEGSNYRGVSRGNSENHSKSSMYNYRLKHNQSHGPNLKRNNFSFINSKLGSEDIINQLMDYDINKTIDFSGVRSNLTTNKTSLILPPISIGNMMSTFDLNGQQIKSKDNKHSSRFVSPINSNKNFGVITNRSKISIKSEIADKFLKSSVGKDIIVQTNNVVSPDKSLDQLNISFPNIDTSKLHRPIKRPKKLHILSQSTHLPSSILTKKSRRQNGIYSIIQSPI